MTEGAVPLDPPSLPPRDPAFGEQLVALQPALRAFAANLRCRHVDDLVQEAIARAWRSRTAFDPTRGTCKAWLLRIAFRVFLDQRRTAAAVDASGVDVADAAPSPARRAMARDESERVLASLASEQRTVLLLFHRDGLSIAEIAARLRQPTGTVKSTLHRARERLWRLHGHEEQP